MRLNLILSMLALCILSACSTLSVNYDYNQKIDFNRYKTFDWLPFPEDTQIDELNRARFVSAVESNLTKKGFTQDTSKPDFVIATHFGKENKIDITNWGYSYAPSIYYGGHGYLHTGIHSYGYADGYTITGGISVYEYEQGTLILDIVDADTKKLIWRATAKEIIRPAATPEKQTEKVNNAVTKILENFPPKK